MKLRIFIFLASIIPSIGYCADDLVPIVCHDSPYEMLGEPARGFLLQETRDLPVWAGMCKRNPQFVENMRQLSVVSDEYVAGCCTAISAQQELYAWGFKCENPCLYIAATGLIADSVSSALCAATLWGLLSMKVGVPIVVCSCIPCSSMAGYGLCAAHKRHIAKDVDQLEYIMNLNNLDKRPESSHDYYSGDFTSY